VKTYGFSFYQPGSDANSGLDCLCMVAAYYGKQYTAAGLRDMLGAAPNEQISLWDICRVAEKIEFRARYVKLTYDQLITQARLPCMVKCRNERIVILVSKPSWRNKRKLICIDTVEGVIGYSKEDFLHQWVDETPAHGSPTGFVLILEPTFKFNEKQEDKETGIGWRSVLRYFKECRRQVIQVFIALLLISILQLVFPFLMQSIVDVGINTQDMHYITIILIAQLMLVFSRCIIEFIRGQLLLYMSTIVSLSILSDFWVKLMRLPVAYFENNHTGHIMQRINDNRQVQNFLTGPALRTFFSMLNFLVFAVVLYIYKAQLLLVFGIGVLLYFTWMRFFLPVRRKINYRIFDLLSRQNDTTLQLVQGIQDIRLQNVEQSKRWEWESLQAERYKLNRKNLSFGQFQQVGAVMINEGKDVVLTLMVAKLVIDGQLTFGAMLALQYIIGQLSGPVEQFIGFIQNAQDAKISMDRLNEVHQMKNEESKEDNYIRHLPESKTITIDDLSFAYQGKNGKSVLSNLRLKIPEGKTTAIIGISGSGKTTLVKLLLKFYDNYEGHIKIGDVDLKDISSSYWRAQCGALLQNGFIFDDTIAMNIVMEHQRFDYIKLIEACRIANLLPFIESLSEGFNTRLGVRGTGISEGQKQRLLIARTIYRNPTFLFFDESTNALDSNNEKVILENLQSFFKNKTVIVIAHRLSTVKNADKIIVMEEGCIIEQGNHQELSLRKGKYVELLKNQLELGDRG
jgi:ATP-binding cassette subfamily B protein